MPRFDCVALPSATALQKQQMLIALGPSIPVSVQGPIVDPANAPPAETVLALVDTGASDNCIDSQLATRLKLKVVDRQMVGGAGGAMEHDVVLGQIHIAELGHSINGRFLSVHLAQGGQHHQVILGRTFLSNCVMIYDGAKGAVSLMK